MYDIALQILLSTASGLLATTYGFGEYTCNDVKNPQPCAYGAVTSSGEVFDPQKASAAIAAPFSMRLKPTWIRLKLVGPYPCRTVRLNDKMNKRWIGTRGFDLSPAAVKLLTSRKPMVYWSGAVEVCH